MVSNEMMVATLECYIHQVKGTEIKIQLPKTPQQYMLMVKAFENCKGNFIKL